jgi:hypothetical protein
MRFFVFWNVTQRTAVVTDVSGPPTGPIFKGQTVQKDCTALPLQMGLIGCPETSVATNKLCLTSQKTEDLFYTARIS